MFPIVENCILRFGVKKIKFSWSKKICYKCWSKFYRNSYVWILTLSV